MSSDRTKWFVIENIATMAATVAVISIGLHYGLGAFALFGLGILSNLNTKW